MMWWEFYIGYERVVKKIIILIKGVDLKVTGEVRIFESTLSSDFWLFKRHSVFNHI